eukprot:COSAG01_NODE_56885_length_315_cov_2.143519_1_plen_73_part_10
MAVIVTTVLIPFGARAWPAGLGLTVRRMWMNAHPGRVSMVECAPTGGTNTTASVVISFHTGQANDASTHDWH